MNREIKFRAWDYLRKIMLYQGVHFSDLSFVKGEFKPVLYNSIEDNWNWYKNKTDLMEYTGLKDKNGKEVYEGDIVYCESNIPHILINITGIVKFLNGSWVISIGGLGNQDLYSYGVDIEKLGNIYENPEILKK